MIHTTVPVDHIPRRLLTSSRKGLRPQILSICNKESTNTENGGELEKKGSMIM